MPNTKIKLAILSASVLFLGAGCDAVMPALSGWWDENQQKVLDVLNKTRESTGKGLSEEQKASIDAWLSSNKFNMYGDSENTMYAGGTPLFDEATGETTDRFEHLFKKFPNLLDVVADSVKGNLKQ